MPILQADRIALSLKIVSADAEIAGLNSAKSSLLIQESIVQKLDTANKNLFDPVNAMVDAYHAEIAVLDGNVRSSIVEQDIQDAASKKIQNHFFPNDTTVTVPSLTALRNVWPRVQPFALSFSIGKNYLQVFPSSTQKESDLINSALSLISSASSNLDIENTSGQHVDPGVGTCSISGYTTQATCEAAVPTPGVWTPGTPTITTYPAVVTLKSNLVTTVSALITFLNSELTLIPVDPANQLQNQSGKDNINNIILPALNAWLAQPDFNPVPNTVTPSAFPTYDSNTLAPTKLHSSQLNTLQAALNARLSFATTRIAQISAVLGAIDQDINTGNINSSSGLYGKRYSYLGLRINALGGSLTQLSGLQTASNAQESIKSNTIATKTTYMSFLPTTKLKANAAGTNVVHVVDPSFIARGDQVYIYAENQEELVRGVSAVEGDMVTLSDLVPAKYTTSTKARLYKDLS